MAVTMKKRANQQKVEERPPSMQTPEAFTPDGIEEARRQWDFAIERSQKHTQKWQIIAILALVLALFSVWFAAREAGRPNMIPYVVTVDGVTGRVDFRGVIQPRALEASDAVVRHHLLRFLRATRTVSTDQQITRDFLQDAYVISTRTAAEQLTEMISQAETNPLQLSADGIRRDINVQLFEQLGDRLWAVEWVEEQREDGRIMDSRVMRGTFSFLTGVPEDELEAELNPFGFYIDEFYFTERR